MIFIHIQQWLFCLSMYHRISLIVAYLIFLMMRVTKTRPAGERPPPRHCTKKKSQPNRPGKPPNPGFTLQGCTVTRSTMTDGVSDHCNYPLVGGPKPTTGATGRRPATIFSVASEGMFFAATRIFEPWLVSFSTGKLTTTLQECWPDDAF